MEKKYLFNLLLSYILQSGFNKNIQDEELKEILNDAGYEQNEQTLVLLRNWVRVIEKVLENPLAIRRTKAINELIDTGIPKQDAEIAIKRIVGIATETSTKNEVDVLPNIIKPVIAEKPEPELILQPIQNEKQEQPKILNEGWVCKNCGKIVKGELVVCPFCEGILTPEKEKPKNKKLAILCYFICQFKIRSIVVSTFNKKILCSCKV